MPIHAQWIDLNQVDYLLLQDGCLLLPPCEACDPCESAIKKGSLRKAVESRKGTKEIFRHQLSDISHQIPKPGNGSFLFSTLRIRQIKKKKLNFLPLMTDDW